MFNRNRQNMAEVSQVEFQAIELEKLRARHREEKQAYREHQREFMLNRVRFLGREEKSDLSNCDISSLAKSLKTKSQVTGDLLNAILNKLFNSKENVEAFLSVDGALESLLRVLSGQNEKFQLIAIHCICNLALGDSKKSFRVLKASLSYLCAHLLGRNCYVKEACLIALGNFSRHGPKHIELLKDQEVLTKIINLINDSDDNLESAAVYALTQFVYHGFDVLKAEELKACLVVILPIFRTRSFSVAFLLSVLSCSSHIHALFIEHQMHQDVLKRLIVSLKEDEQEAVFYLRILSHFIAEESLRAVIENNCDMIRECVYCMLASDKGYLKTECLGFLGNLINHEMFQVFGVELLKENYDKVEAHVKILKQR